MQATMDTETVRERLEELGEELQTVTSLVHLTIKNQQHEGLDDAQGAFDCSGNAERKFQALKGEVQTLARVLDGNGTSLSSLTTDSLTDVKRLTEQAARCETAIHALDGLCQAEQHLTSSQQLLAKNEYVAAADAVASAEVLLGDLQYSPSSTGAMGAGADKENRQGRNSSRSSVGDSGVMRALKRLLLKRRAGLESHLRDVASSSMELGRDDATIRCRKVLSGYLCGRCYRSPVPFVAVFEALMRLGQLEALFAELARTLREKVFNPLLSPGNVPPPKRFADDELASLVYAPPSEGNGLLGSVGISTLAEPASQMMVVGRDGEGVGALGQGSDVEGPEIVAEYLTRVSVVLEFIHEEVLGRRCDLTAALGARLLFDADGLNKTLLEKLDDGIPQDARYLANFEEGACDACRVFETRLASMGYLGEDAAAEAAEGLDERPAPQGSLLRFVETVEGRFAAKRRRTLLQQARDMALGDYHNSVEVSDAFEGSPLADFAAAKVSSSQGKLNASRNDGAESRTFRLETCQVSTVAKSLVELVRATLKEACSKHVPPLCAKELFRTARDMLDLFRAVIPVQHANALEGVPRIAAVFQNDCLYLAHHMVTLGHEFRQDLPPPANETATMIDTVPLFRELAAKSLSDQQKRQQRQLQEFFADVDVLASTATSSSLLRATDAAFEDLFPADGSDRLPGARSGASGVRFHKADGVETEEAGYGEAPVEEGEAAAAVRKSVYHLRQLKQAWCKVLPDRVYKRVMGALLSLVAGKVCTPVLGAKDLEEEQTHALHRIFKSLTEAAQDIFDSPAEAAQRTPGWSKAVVVGQIMELGLEPIGEMLQGDAFSPLTADELSGLIRAIFQDTVARAALVAAISQNQG
ncbi:unnamed protein product [Ascophyllum nodosum]